MAIDRKIAAGNPTFVFVWRRVDRNAWHTKRVVAADLQSAIDVLRKHLERRKDFPLGVVVDHPVQESRGEATLNRHSLTQVASPFRIEFDNTAHAVGHFPAR